MFGHVAVWTITPRPRLMKPTMESPGTGLQQWAMRTIMSSTPRTEMPPVLGGGGALLLALAVGDDRIHGASGVSRISGGEINGLQTLHHLLGRETRVPDGGHQLVH